MENITPKKVSFRYVDGNKIILSPINGKKTCVFCLIEKDLKEFYRTNVSGRCKKCYYNEYCSKKIPCICGRTYTQLNKSRHFQTKIHATQLLNQDKINSSNSERSC